MDNKYLAHHGIKGMRWGVRRYQNYDGSLTPAGARRRAQDMNSLSNKKKKNYTADPHRWVREDMERSKRLADSSSHMTNELKRINEKKMRNSPKTKIDLSNMSDKELRDKINRAMLEKQYNDMFAPQKTSKGREYTAATLDVAGDVLAVTGSALAVALSIKALKGR